MKHNSPMFSGPSATGALVPVARGSGWFGMLKPLDSSPAIEP
jgi:hypothetical protein